MLEQHDFGKRSSSSISDELIKDIISKNKANKYDNIFGFKNYNYKGGNKMESKLAKGRRVLLILLNARFKDLETLIKKPNITMCCSLDETKTVLYDTYGKDEDKFIITTDTNAISADLTDFNPKYNYEVHIGRIKPISNTDNIIIKTLRIYPHMNTVDKDVLYVHNWQRLTTGHIFDTALENSEESIPELEVLGLQLDYNA